MMHNITENKEVVMATRKKKPSKGKKISNKTHFINELGTNTVPPRPLAPILETGPKKDRPLDLVPTPVKKREPFEWVEVKPHRQEAGDFAIVSLMKSDNKKRLNQVVLYQKGTIIGFYPSVKEAEDAVEAVLDKG